ncbi:hypothetical protein H8K90_04270 [Winogradskyella echinorum]|uniref:Uncharacterized protein n=1 Tax=Winogradskyella echinorum TaxID=538189 RepID=A0ABR6XYL1_9FLAO|nr:hypothetical protein [Winogradskyella echinorum]MBC3845589.1 hypothetical protein [Winogradskyella echinorum]MBC5749937.1 hypothetical protein [Winogradskyella echinorum]
MGKKKKNKKLKEERIKVLQTSGFDALGKVKSKCCKKYKKAENKRCKKCPCFDLLKKVA